MTPPTFSIVVPIFNEADVIQAFCSEIKSQLQEAGPFKVLFVDDGSTDNTFELATRISQSDPRFSVIRLSRNFGHQAALTAGMDHATGEAIVCMDGDLQHPVSLIPQMLSKWREGFDIVYTVRKSSAFLGLFKRASSRLFYKMINSLSNVPIQESAADFRLISRKVAKLFKNDLRERQRFLRGLVSWVGFRSTAIAFEVQKRRAGKSKYSWSKMMTLAKDSLLSFSTFPLRVGIYAGLAFGALSLAFGLYAIFMALFTDKTVSGWASLLTLTAFIGSIQFVLLGLIGEYIAGIFNEIKGRPIYVIRETINLSPDPQGKKTEGPPSTTEN